MLAPFEKLSLRSRIWIYQANRSLSDTEQRTILKSADSFVQQWAAHGQSLLASATVLYDHFFIIATDENFNMASGCSIDSSFRFVQESGSHLNIDFFQRTNLAFLVDNKVELIQMNALKQAIEDGRISEETSFFDNNIHTKSELETQWIVNAGESWLKRYFQTTKSVL